MRLAISFWTLLACTGGTDDAVESRSEDTGPGDARETSATAETGTPYTAAPDSIDVELRVVHALPKAGPVDLCIAPSADDPFEGPLLGGKGVAFREGTVRQTTTVSSSARLRWVAAASPDCENSIGDDVALEGNAGPRTAVLLAPASETDEPTTLLLDDETVAKPNPGRFYVRFLHAAPGVDPLSVKQGGCAIPFAAFESAAFGEPAISANDQAPWFSASVTSGSDRFVTDIVVCDGPTELVRLEQHAFLGGQIQLHVLTGDATTPSTLDLTMCIDTASEPCTRLL
ncbi:MAG: hypothetical protein AAGA48_02585 [Myxococcota bacterium]